MTFCLMSITVGYGNLSQIYIEYNLLVLKMSVQIHYFCSKQVGRYEKGHF